MAIYPKKTKALNKKDIGTSVFIEALYNGKSYGKL